ncbi:Transmembrane protein 225 [Camelus dromedarius]|uniref:Transmembrane protein 225 n=1 Tax=Camelus dromedarius TaxID=9838 RepID=A0A5N4C7D8_CAMDR|nr:Transmembrane protein 225 [Camelus dromedarius]
MKSRPRETEAQKIFLFLKLLFGSQRYLIKLIRDIDTDLGGLKVVRDMMLLVFSLSLLHNLLLGLEFTYMIPQTKHILFMTASLSFFTAFLVLWLRYAASELDLPLKWDWPLGKHKQSMNSSASLTIIPESAQEDQVMEQSGASVKDLVLPADAAVPRSIVHVHATQAKDSPSRTQVQGRRVTWTL